MYSYLRGGTVLVTTLRIKSTYPCQFAPQGLQRAMGVLFEPKAAEKVLSDNQREADKHGICGAKDTITGEDRPVCEPVILEQEDCCCNQGDIVSASSTKPEGIKFRKIYIFFAV